LRYVVDGRHFWFIQRLLTPKRHLFRLMRLSRVCCLFGGLEDLPVDVSAFEAGDLDCLRPVSQPHSCVDAGDDELFAAAAEELPLHVGEPDVVSEADPPGDCGLPLCQFQIFFGGLEGLRQEYLDSLLREGLLLGAGGSQGWLCRLAATDKKVGGSPGVSAC
jgi:hypothetical protein